MSCLSSQELRFIKALEPGVEMVKPHLRLHSGSLDSPPAADPAERKPVQVPLGHVFPILADCLESDRTWLRDFEDESVTISADLYDIILAHQYFHRPSA